MSILDRIVQDTREGLPRRKRDVPLSRLEDSRYFSRTPLRLVDALRRDELAVIAEVKKASPSKGIIRENFVPRDIALEYEEAGAAAISVLTEPLHFEGSLAHLEAIRGAVELPLLRKDFVIDVYQLVEARAHGADAVLLIAAVLDRAQLHDLVQAATALELAALVEVYDLGEIDRIDFDEVSILGVNNRDLRTFEVDVGHSLRVFQHVPPEIIRVSESGLSSARELRRLQENGVDAALIGESLMKAERPGAALKELLGEMEEEEWRGREADKKEEEDWL